MNRPWLFGLLTFLFGWTIQIPFLFVSQPGSATPHILLLTVLALGGLGKTNLAQTLGFFWGLGLDVFGVGLFGTQGLLLVVAGFLSGRFSRQLNAEKWVTQETMAFLGTAFFYAGLLGVDHLFRTKSAPSSHPAVTILLEFILNALAAPVVFWLVRTWGKAWTNLTGRHVVHD